MAAQTNGGWINFAYFDEANQFGTRARRRLHHPAVRPRQRAARSRRRSTACSRTRPDETKTQTEKDFNIGFFKQIGDIGLIVRWILFAVFFTLLLVVGNTIAQSVRERIPELAILKTLGFSDGRCSGSCWRKPLRCASSAGLLGLAIATPLGVGNHKGTGGYLPLAVDGEGVADGGRRDRRAEPRRGAAAGACARSA